MPSNVSYPRKYYSTTYAELDTIPLKEGNVISLYDTDGLYYDVGNPAGSGQNVIRRKASNIEYVSSLSEARQEPTTIFVIQNATMQDEEGNTVISYSGYRWNEDSTPAKFDEIFNNLRDFKVKSTSSDSTKAYIVGSVESTDTIGTLVKNPNIYLTATGNKIHAGLEGVADNATEAIHATSADLATSAINDNASSPKAITTYLYDVSSDATTGTILTFTLGDGTTKTVRAADTQYDIYSSQDAGLVPGTDTQVTSDPLAIVLSGSGWIPIADITMPLADSAEKDGEGQVIASTYVKSASYDTTNDELTLTFGDGTTSSPISIPNTEYSVFDTTDNGLVPAASTSGDTSKFLKGDGTWADITATIGLYPGSDPTNPVSGLVPAATSLELEGYLKGDGTWGSTFTQGVDGLVPGPNTNDSAYTLRADGTWGVCPDTTNTAGSSNDTSNMLYLVGAQTQDSDGVITYSNVNVFINNGQLYCYSNTDSAAAQVVTVSDTQALTNKTYNGYTLGTACAGTIASTVDVANPDYLPTNSAVVSYTSGRLATIINVLDTKVPLSMVAPTYDDTSTYSVGDYSIYDDGNGAVLYKCNTAISTPEDFDDSKWDATTIIDIINSL